LPGGNCETQTLPKKYLVRRSDNSRRRFNFGQFERQFPDVKLKRGLRFVEGKKISTAGGLTSGIDLALRVVERYFGREVAEQTAFYMEYQSKGWMV
jgi:transcriptional regulator GlxA family with amidase domain